MLTESQLQDIRIAAFDAGVTLRERYSGRGMYGHACISIVVDCPGDAESFLAELRAADSELAGALGTPSSDNMGRRVIVYWPGAQAPSAREGEK